MSRFREKLSPANWMQGVTAISLKISRSWAPRLQNSQNRWAKKWGPTCDRDISNPAIYTTAIYRAYTVYYRLSARRVKSASKCLSCCLFSSFYSSEGKIDKIIFLNLFLKRKWPTVLYRIFIQMDLQNYLSHNNMVQYNMILNTAYRW